MAEKNGGIKIICSLIGDIETKLHGLNKVKSKKSLFLKKDCSL
jgi:hypothetical protein